MSVDFIFKIAAIGMIVAVLNTLLVRSGREDQAMLTTLAGVIVVLMMLVPKISALFSAADGAAEKREPHLCFAGHCGRCRTAVLHGV